MLRSTIDSQLFTPLRVGQLLVLGLLLLISLCVHFFPSGDSGNSTKGQTSTWDRKAWEPEPRHYMPGWTKTHENYVDETKATVREGKEKLDLLFLGDSITEAWRGFDRGMACFGGRCDAVPAVWNEHFCHLNAMSFGISGDRTEHLLWRLQDGEALGLAPRMIILLIGTNNLGWARKKSADFVHASADDTARGIQEVILLLKKMMPLSDIVVLGNFPRGDRSWDGPVSGEGDEKFIHYAQPSVFTPALDQSNSQVRAWVEQSQDNSGTLAKRYTFLDCSEIFRRTEGSIDEGLMPDALHPSAEGYKLLLNDCLWPILSQHGISRMQAGEGVTTYGQACAEKANQP